MKKYFTLCLGLVLALTVSAQWPSSLIGRWTFDDQANPLTATTGNNLLLVGSHQTISGPVAGDNAVRIGVGR